MAIAEFLAKAGIYLVMFALSFYAMGALDFSRFLKQGHPTQAQILYGLLVLALAYMAGSFIIAIVYIH
ncbi:MAG: DUF1146 domain-containing protein [Solobacterium sp.]|nr:DUF1146 domain-containing protein [Solobacterium sp.]